MRREVLYNILVVFPISMKLVSSSKVRTGKNMSDAFRIENDLKLDA
jgi:hypothetical protein